MSRGQRLDLNVGTRCAYPVAMLCVELEVLGLEALVVTVRRGSAQQGIGELGKWVRCDALRHLLIVMTDSDFTADEVQFLMQILPRRLRDGRVAVLHAASQRGAAAAVANWLSIPLIPRPVRLFTLEQVSSARTWIVSGRSVQPRNGRLPVADYAFSPALTFAAHVPIATYG